MALRPRLAVVGCGYWGSKHARVIFETPSASLALVVDPRAERLQRIAESYPGVATAQHLSAALDDPIDGIVIATPISTHYELARQALLAGKHVLVEKPLATTTRECRELIELARRNDRVLMVGHTFEYHPAVTYLRDLVRSGDLGDLYYIDCARLNLGLFQPDADVLWDLAPHDFSILFYLLGEPARSVSARGRSHVLPGVPDVVHANLDFGSGLAAHVHVSWLDPCKVRRVTVVGSSAMAVFNDVAPIEKIRIYDKRFTPALNGDGYADFQASYHHGNVVIPPVSTAEPLRLECEDFVRGIATGQPVRCDGDAGLRVVEALEAASRSLRHDGRTEAFPSVDPLHSLPGVDLPDLAGLLPEVNHATAD